MKNVGREGLEPSRPKKSTDFKSVMSTIPSLPQIKDSTQIRTGE